MTREKIAELRALDQAATPGPWDRQTQYEMAMENMDLLVAVRNALPALLDAAERGLGPSGDAVHCPDCQGLHSAPVAHVRGQRDVRDVACPGITSGSNGENSRLVHAADDALAAQQAAERERDTAREDSHQQARTIQRLAAAARDRDEVDATRSRVVAADLAEAIAARDAALLDRDLAAAAVRAVERLRDEAVEVADAARREAVALRERIVLVLEEGRAQRQPEVEALRTEVERLRAAIDEDGQ